MQSFEIVTDSAANLPEFLIEKHHLHVLSLTYYVDGVPYKGNERNKEISMKTFYDMMRAKKEVTTSWVKKEDAYQLGEELAEAGKDILYIGFSSGLSATYQVVSMELEKIQEKYPNRCIYSVDSLSAALGEGLFVKYIIDLRDQGKSIGEVYEWALENRFHICHEFTVDDLFFLRRGGRITAASAMLGTALSVKPIMHVDDKGHLVNLEKVRGRKKSLDALVSRMEKYIVDPEEQEVYISHGDCLEDAEYLAEQIKERVGVKDVMMRILDPVIGAHSGPGTVALFYYGRQRQEKLEDTSPLMHIFIVNPYSGSQTFADELRKKLEAIQGLNYYIFSTRHAGYEREVIRQIQDLFHGEKLRFYCCGGSGTLRNMLNGFEDLKDVEIAFYPCGLSNDFLKVFGEENAKRFKNIEELIHGEVIDVDYIKTSQGICLNTFTTGIDSDMYLRMEKYRNLYILGKQLPYTLSVAEAIFLCKPRELEVYIDGEKHEAAFSELLFGNGYAIGGDLFIAENTNVTDGVGVYCIAKGGSTGLLMKQMLALKNKNFGKLDSITERGTWRKIRIVSKDGEPINANQDGEIINGKPEWEAEIVPRGLHFVVPGGVEHESK